MKLKLQATVAGVVYTHEVDPESATARGYMERGFQKVLTDASSTCKGYDEDADGKKTERKATDEERQAAVQARLEKLLDGSYQFGGGGGFKATTPEAKALKFTLQKFGVKFAKGDTIDDGLEALTKATAEKAGKDFDPAMIETIREQLEASQIYVTRLELEQAQATAGKPEIEGLAV